MIWVAEVEYLSIRNVFYTRNVKYILIRFRIDSIDSITLMKYVGIITFACSMYSYSHNACTSFITQSVSS